MPASVTAHVSLRTIVPGQVFYGVCVELVQYLRVSFKVYYRDQGTYVFNYVSFLSGYFDTAMIGYCGPYCRLVAWRFDTSLVPRARTHH